MESTLDALGGLLLKAAPTFVLIVLLHFYFKFVFFKPLARTLRERYEATEGARKLAEQSLERAAAKTAEYEAAVRAARAEIYKTQEHIHKELQERHTADLAAARQRADAAVKAAKEEVAREVEAAKASLGRDVEMLSNQIADTILRRSAA